MSKKTCWFIDWTAVPTSSWHETVLEEEISLTKAGNTKIACDVPESITYWRRMDGIILFAIDFLTEGLSTKECVGIATFVSSQIKRNLGLHNEEIALAEGTLVNGDFGFPTISVSPIKISTNSDLTLKTAKKILETDAKLLELKARDIAGRHDGNGVRAVFLLRGQFSRSFETAYKIKDRIKAAKMKNLPFLKYNWGFSVFVYLLFFVGNSTWSYYLYWSGPPEGKTGPDYMKELVDSTIQFNIAVGFAVVLVLYSLVIQHRRRKTIKAIDKSITVLRLGNIYCDALCRIAQGETVKENTGNFEYSIEILCDLKEKEIKKKLGNMWLLTSLFFITGSLVIKLISHELPFWKPIFTMLIKPFY